MQPHVKELPSYVKDTTDFLNKVDQLEKVPENSTLVSLDVKSLYTNIPNNEGISAVKKHLDRKKLTNALSIVITTFLTLILTLNNFVFNCINYLQTNGCAMGTKCAPSYANLFMGMFEEEYILPLIKEKTLIYLRYIDDIFFIWTGSKEKLNEIYTKLNTLHHSIKFDMTSSQTEINFLDTKVMKSPDGTIKTKHYKKSTDRPSYLHKNSEHPKSLKNSIPYAQGLRIKKICSTQEDYNNAKTELIESFEKRGYDKENLKTQLQPLENIDRKDLLKYKEKTVSDKIPLTVTYNRTLPPLKNITDKHWHLLQLNDELKETFKEKPTIAYKRNKNLKDIIGQNTIVNNKVQRKKEVKKVGKCRPCLTKSGNQCCKQVKNTDQFVSHKYKTSYKIFNNSNCKSKHLIYLLECTKCKIQYVGKCETPFNQRINNHRKDSKLATSIPASRHFKTNHDFNKDAKFTIIERIENTSRPAEVLTQQLKRRENFWIKKLGTLAPDGLNQELNTIT